MDIRMAIQAGACKHAVLSGSRPSVEGFELCVDGPGMASRIMAALAQKRRLRGQELSVIAAVGRMACQAILFNRRMLPHEWSPFLGMARVAKLIHIISPGHLRPESAMLIMTLGALHKSFFQGVMGLPVLLGADVLVTVIAERWFLGLQIFPLSRMDTVAIVAGNIADFVPTQIPEGNGP
jgi:hypothetical protein